MMLFVSLLAVLLLVENWRYSHCYKVVSLHSRFDIVRCVCSCSVLVGAAWTCTPREIPNSVLHVDRLWKSAQEISRPKSTQATRVRCTYVRHIIVRIVAQYLISFKWKTPICTALIITGNSVTNAMVWLIFRCSTSLSKDFSFVKKNILICHIVDTVSHWWNVTIINIQVCS